MPEQVVLKREHFDKRDMYEERIAFVSVPELNPLLGIQEGEDKVAIFEVRQLSLSGFLAARTEINDRVRNLVEGILAATADKSDVEAEVKKAIKEKVPEVYYRMEVLVQGVKNPPLRRSDAVFLCDKFPMVVARLVEKIMELTDKGADLKKNFPG